MHNLHAKTMGQQIAGNSPQNPDSQFQDRPQSRSGSGMPGGMPGQFAGPSGVPPNNRPMTGPPPGKMLPPPSPSVANKKPDGSQGGSPAGITASSPRNMPMPGSQAPTPGMPGPGNPPQLGQGGPPQTPIPPNNALSGPSPAAILGTPVLPPSMPPAQSQPPMGTLPPSLGSDDFSDLFSTNMDFSGGDGNLFSDLNSFDWSYTGPDGPLPGM